ncbi:hypothetical protein, partial [Clostridium botulinum]|uniref:hypothetical protein n=1 Tax=Clostridium botulinum TaxID=1491 RepID=UPI0021C1E953
METVVIGKRMARYRCSQRFKRDKKPFGMGDTGDRGNAPPSEFGKRYKGFGIPFAPPSPSGEWLQPDGFD